MMLPDPIATPAASASLALGDIHPLTPLTVLRSSVLESTEVLPKRNTEGTAGDVRVRASAVAAATPTESWSAVSRETCAATSSSPPAENELDVWAWNHNDCRMRWPRLVGEVKHSSEGRRGGGAAVARDEFNGPPARSVTSISDSTSTPRNPAPSLSRPNGDSVGLVATCNCGIRIGLPPLL